MNAIEWTRKAVKQLSKLPQDDNRAVRRSVDALKELETAQNVKALKNHRYDYRLRVGRYRVFFDFVSSVKIVRIEEVRKRDERTY